MDAHLLSESGFRRTVSPRHALIAHAVRETINPARAESLHRGLAEVTTGFPSILHRLSGAESWSASVEEHLLSYIDPAVTRGEFSNISKILRQALRIAEGTELRGELMISLILAHAQAKTVYECLDLLPEIETFERTITREFMFLLITAHTPGGDFPLERVTATLRMEARDPEEQTLQAFLAFFLVLMTMRSPAGAEGSMSLIPVTQQLLAQAPENPDALRSRLYAWMVSPRAYTLLLDCYAMVPLYQRGRQEELQRVLPDLMERARLLPKSSLKVDCLLPLAAAQMASGNVRQARDTAADAVRLMETVDMPWAGGSPYSVLVDALVILGELDSAGRQLALFEDIVDYVLDIESRTGANSLKAVIAAITGSGDPDSPTEQFTKHVNWDHYSSDAALLAACEVARAQGDPAGVLQATADPGATVLGAVLHPGAEHEDEEATPLRHDTLWGYLTYRAHALLDLGQFEEAEKLIEQLALLRGWVWFEYWGSLDWLRARLAQAQGDTQGAAEFYASAVLIRDYPLPHALTLADQAEFLAAQGQLKRAESAALESLEELDRIGAHGYISRARAALERIRECSADHASARLDQLTEREQEVAALVATGRSNPQIAEILVVSQPTVRFHVSNILRKLNLSSRGQVAAALGDAPGATDHHPQFDTPER
ncbi:MAG: LuxR C-terminal-related transcriptional regulator [Galactobacter sp.]